MGKFAFDICGGDVLFVKDSLSQQIIGCGLVSGEKGVRAYRFEKRNPVVTPSGYPWRHYVNVDWIEGFSPIAHSARAQLVTVLELNESEVAAFGARLVTKPEPIAVRSIKEAIGRCVLEKTYLRSVPASTKIIAPRHQTLSNAFCGWLRVIGVTEIVQELECLDVSFSYEGSNMMAELKICYGGNTGAAVREALGQILDYNLRRGRRAKDRWLLILDSPPFAEDLEFIQTLRDRHNLPLFLGWKTAEVFEVSGNWKGHTA